jgi:hypothetical protein
MTEHSRYCPCCHKSYIPRETMCDCMLCTAKGSYR